MQQDKVRVKKRLPSQAATGHFEDFAASATGSAASAHPKGKAEGVAPSSVSCADSFPTRGKPLEKGVKGASKKRVRVTAKLLVHEADAKCPFFHWAKGQTIACEGFYPGAGIVQRFQKIRDAEAQVRFCCGKYKNCELYRAIMEARYAGELDRG
jgi:hypothetical protein